MIALPRSDSVCCNFMKKAVKDAVSKGVSRVIGGYVLFVGSNR
jgi:hypothetical protein